MLNVALTPFYRAHRDTPLHKTLLCSGPILSNPIFWAHQNAPLQYHCYDPMILNIKKLNVEP